MLMLLFWVPLPSASTSGVGILSGFCGLASNGLGETHAEKTLGDGPTMDVRGFLRTCLVRQLLRFLVKC